MSYNSVHFFLKNLNNFIISIQRHLRNAHPGMVDEGEKGEEGGATEGHIADESDIVSFHFIDIVLLI